MAHTRACAEAKGDICACAGCGGSKHGWSGGLWLAVVGTEAERDLRAAEIDRTWCGNFDEEQPVSSRVNRQAAIAAAKLGFIQWLARNWDRYLGQSTVQPVRSSPDSGTGQPGDEDQGSVLQELAKRKGQELPRLPDETFVKAIDELGSAIANNATQAIDKLFEGDKKKQNDIRKQLAKHFWCDLFANLAYAIDTFRNSLDRVPDWVTDAILRSRHAKKRPLIERLIVQTAVKHAWTVVQQAIEHTFNVEKVLIILRVLAFLCCPAPEKHPAVIKYCVIPLGNAVLEPAIKEKLKAMLSEELTRELNLNAPTMVD